MQLNLTELIKKSHFFLKLIYKIEKKRITTIETDAKYNFDQIWTIAKKDAIFFGTKTKIFPTYVNIDEYKFKKSMPKDINSIIFSGNLNYYPNVDAVLFFYNIFQKIKVKYPNLLLHIAGKGWHRKLNLLKSDSSVIILGEVGSMNKTLLSADLVVCPMNIAS